MCFNKAFPFLASLMLQYGDTGSFQCCSDALGLQYSQPRCPGTHRLLVAFHGREIEPSCVSYTCMVSSCTAVQFPVDDPLPRPMCACVPRYYPCALLTPESSLLAASCPSSRTSLHASLAIAPPRPCCVRASTPTLPPCTPTAWQLPSSAARPPMLRQPLRTPRPAG